MLHPPAHPAEQSCAGGGTRTHYGIVVMNSKPTWVIGLAQKGMGKGWTRRPGIRMASHSTPAHSATLHTTPNSFQERHNACLALPQPSPPTLPGSRCPPVSSIRTDFHAKGSEPRKRTVLERGSSASKMRILQAKSVPEPMPISIALNTILRELLGHCILGIF